MAANNTIMFSRSLSRVCACVCRGVGAGGRRGGGRRLRAGWVPAARRPVCKGGDTVQRRPSPGTGRAAGGRPWRDGAHHAMHRRHTGARYKRGADRNTAEDSRATARRSPYHWRLRSSGAARPAASRRPLISASLRSVRRGSAQRAHKHRLTTRKEILLQNKEGIG